MPFLPYNYESNVFINCPFDREYFPLFKAIVFAVHDAGFQPRCARERMNAAEVRIDKILTLIEECKYGIHDLSRTKTDSITGLPRFNMPFELGVDFGCRRFGSNHHKGKSLLILANQPFEYQKFLSDISGQDITPHGGRPETAIRQVRDWLATETAPRRLPGWKIIYGRYKLL